MVSNEEKNTATGISFKLKYRELKRRLKYLVYENECFESDIKDAQTKLLHISREKSYLLDQLMAHETVVISDDSDVDSTDYSSEEDRPVQSETLPKITQATKLLKPSVAGSRGHSPAQRQTNTKTTMRGKVRKTTQRGANRQTAASKAVKAVSKAATAATVTTTTSTTAVKPSLLSLVVSLPRKPIVQETKPQTLPLQQPTAVSGVDDGKKETITIGKSQKTKGRSSSGSSTGSSSSTSGTDSQSGSSDSSDSEAMDTRPGVPPPPLHIVDSSPMTSGNPVVAPKPIQSPLKLMTPSALTSLALVTPGNIPLLSPTGSPQISAHHSGPKVSVGNRPTGGSNISAFQIVVVPKTSDSSNSSIQER